MDGGGDDSRGRRRIGLRDVRSLEPGETIWDAAVIGLGVRRQTGPHITYVLSYRTLMGRKRHLTIGRHGSPWLPEDARREARRLLGIVAGGGDPMADREARRGSPVTVAELCDQWLEDGEAGRLLTRRRKPKAASTIETDRSRVNAHIKPMLGRLAVAAVTRADVERLLHAISEGKTRKRVKLSRKHALSNIRGGSGAGSRTVSMLHAIMAHAVRIGLRADNPAHGVIRPADGHRERRLSNEEYAALGAGLIAAEDDEVFLTSLAAIRFLVVTGWRRGEVLGLRWTEIDLGRQTARLANTKTGSSMRPLAKAACAIVEAMPRHGDLVFPAPEGGIAESGFVRVWQRVVQRIAGLPGEVTPHVLRHSLASVAADMGYADATIAGLLGHKGHSITRRYIHSADSALIAAADAVATEIMRMMDKGDGG